MTIYADYTFYQGQYFGKKLTEEEFQSFIINASALINEMTSGRAAAHSDMDEIRYAACAVCEQMFINEKHAGIASETVGKVSRTYITQKSRQLCMDAARAYLMNTGLLMTGVPFCGVE